MKWLDRYFDSLALRIENRIAEAEARIIQQLSPAKPSLTAGDILDISKQRKEQKSSGSKPWRVIQREAELESSPEIQREKRIEKENKEIANA